MTEAFPLKARLDLSASADVLAYLQSIPADEETLLDASAVTHLGALCSQSLLAAGKRCSEAGGRLKLVNVSDRIHQQLGAMGLSLETLMEGQS